MAIETATIEQTQFFPAKRSKVYDQIVQPTRYIEYERPRRKGKPFVGAECTALGGCISVKHVALARPRGFVVEWRTDDWPEGYPPSRIELQFAAKDGGTEVTMVHSQLPAPEADAYRQGWVDFCWEPLRDYFDEIEMGSQFALG